ncbi:transcription factor mef2A isoform X1 [Anopheles darlingi]|uniref:transcription factor mef2A isoform X1 n=1 Tax=Anopheles darlingi TaxID=43151 RepID=UPI0021001979|nr:transcription factor mef2A isoform X1 [Anopheles darlingi]
MICKEDVVNWFRDLKSYNRIDTMCVLLNMCLPFELRFLGTCLEELGRRDGPDLRGAELKVNNPQEFIADIASGDPTDSRIRRMMALFLALFRTSNHTYANEVFKTLEGWGARGDLLQRLFEEDVLEELLLVYTMATNHPVFSCEQRVHCDEILTKLKSCETKSGSQQQRLQERDDSAEHQHPQHHQQHHTTQHHQHHQHQSQHQSLDSLQSNSPQQSPIQQQQQQQQHHQQQSQHQPPHLQNSTPPPVSSQLTSQLASGPDTVSTPLHQALPPNAPMSLQILPQSGVPTTMALSYTGQPALAQVVGTGIDGSITTHYIETMPQIAQLPLQPDFTIPPPGPNTTARWAAFPVYHPMYPPPASSPHMSNPPSPIQSRTTSPTRIHPSSVQHRISRNQQNDQQQQQNQAQVQNLKNVEEDQTTLMMSQMQLRNGMRQPHNTLPRQSKQGYVNQLPSYHHQQQQQQQHHSQRGDSSGSGSYHTLNYGIKGAGMMMDMMNHQSKSTGSDSGSSIGSDVSPPETPGVVPVSGGGGGTGGMGSSGVPHVRSSNRSNMRTINGRLEKPTYSQLQQQQQFASSEGLMVVTSGGQNFLTTGTTNGAAMSSNGNNGASGSGVVSGPLLINPAAAAGTAPPNPGSTGTGTSLLLSTPAYATGPYAASATAYQVGTGAPHLVSHRQIAGATLTHAGTPYRPAAYPPSMQPSTADGLMYPYHTTTVLPPTAGGTPGSVGQASSLPFLPPPTGPGGTAVGSVAVASTQTSLPNLRSSPSQQATTAGVASSSIGLLQTGKTMTITGYGTGIPLVSSTFVIGGGSCYNCGSQKHTGLDCPEASMEDMTRNSNFTLDYNTTSSSGPSSVTLTTSTSTLVSNNNSGTADHHNVGVIKLDRDNSSSSSSTGSSSNNSTSSSGVGTGSTQMTSNSTTSSNSNSSSSNNNNGSNSSNNSNNSSLDVPSSSPTSSSIAVAVDSGNSGVPGATVSTSNISNTTSGSSSGGSGNSSSSSSSNSSNLVNVSGK